MNAISQIQRDIKFQELVVSGQSRTGHGPGILTACPESGSSILCPSQHPLSYPTRPPSGLPAPSQIHPHGTQLVCSGMPAHHSQRNTAIGKGAANRWQTRTKNTPRQQFQHLQQQKNHLQTSSIASSQSGSGYQLQQVNGPLPLAINTRHCSNNQHFVLLEPQASTLPSSASQSILLSPRGNFTSHPHNLGRTTQLQTQGPLPQSTAHNIYPVLQFTKPCVEHQSSTHTYCILEGLPPSPSSPSIAIPCILPSTQPKPSVQKPYYNLSSSNLQSVTVANKSQTQRQQFRCQQQQQQQYSAVRYQPTSPSQSKQQSANQQSQLLVFRPPPREKTKSPIQLLNTSNELCKKQFSKVNHSQNAIQTESTKFPTSSSKPRYLNADNNKVITNPVRLQHQLNNNINISKNQTVNQNSSVVLTPEINSKGLDVITSIQSTWLATQPLGNVHLVMGLSAGNALKKQDSNQISQATNSLPNPIAKPTAFIPPALETCNMLLPPAEENPPQNPHFHSDSSTSFDFSIEAEKMVSALCNSTPMKEAENNDCHGSVENNENSQNKENQILVGRNLEAHMIALEKFRKLNETNEHNLSQNKTQNWSTTVAVESSDDAVSLNSVSTSDFQNNGELGNLNSMTECDDERNVTISPLRLSPSSNSSTSTTKNIEARVSESMHFQENFCQSGNEVTESRVQSKEMTKSSRKVRTVSCQTDIFEGVHDEQLMFRKITVKGCYEIGKLIEEFMSPALEGLNQFCLEVQQAVSKPETLLVSESVQKDLIIGFLRLANCWANLYPCLGASQYKLNNMEALGVDVTQLYQNWTCESRKLMEGIIKIFERQMTEVRERSTENKDVNMEHIDPSQNVRFSDQGFGEYNFNMVQGGYPNSPSTALADVYSIVTPESNEPPLILASMPQNMIPAYPLSPTYNMRTQGGAQGSLNNIHSNHKSNWRLRRFSDMQSDNTGSHNQANTRKNKGTFQIPKDNNRRWNMASSGSAASFHSTYTNTKYGDTPRGNCRKSDEIGPSSSRVSRSESQVTHDRFNRHVGNRFRQKTNTSGKKSSPRLLSVEAHLREKAFETLEFSKHWQQQNDITQANPNELYIGQAAVDESGTISKNKLTPLSQIETCLTPQTSSQHVDLSSWFQNLGGSLPLTVDPTQLTALQNSPEVLYSDRKSQSGTILQSTPRPNQCATSTPNGMSQHSARRHSYQDSRNQLIAGKGKTWSNKRSNNYSKSASAHTTTSHTNIFISRQCDEHDSSDDLQDRVYMKPGSYDVPKRKPSVSSSRGVNPMMINANVNTPVTTLSTGGVIVPFPAAPIVPPPSHPMSPKIFRNLLIPKTQDKPDSSTSVKPSHESSDSSDLAWKAACASAETLLETLQGSGRSQKSSDNQKSSEEECAEKNNDGNTGDSSKAQSSSDGNDNETITKKASAASEKRKSNIVKTDDWLISTFNNASKLQNEIKNKEDSKEDEDQSPTTEVSTSNVKTNMSEGTLNLEIQKVTETHNNSNGQKCNTSKNPTSKRKDGKKDEEQHTPRSRKPVNGSSGKKHSHHQESGRSNSDSRKRKLQERSPNEDQQPMQTKNEDFATTSEQSQQTLANNKSKNDIRNKATWNVWYSSRRRRGLSILAVNKLEDILNVVWNMDASDFVKYPVSSSDVDDYYKHVKHPMFLETIGYKLKNRIYETIEQFVHDFRRIFVNAKLYNQDNPVYLNLTKVLEVKFNSLLEEHFSGWEFGHITGDPNETTNYPALKYLAFTEKSTSSKNRRAKSSGKGVVNTVSNQPSKSATNSSTPQSSS